MMDCLVKHLDDKCAVTLKISDDDGTSEVQFTRPITKDDLKGGEVIIPCRSFRHKSKLVTTVRLGPQAIRALQELLNEMLAEE